VRGEVAVRPRHARLAPHHPPDQHSDSRCGRQDQSRALEVAGLDREPDPRVPAGDLRGERGREPLHVYGEPSEVQQDRSGLHGLSHRHTGRTLLADVARCKGGVRQRPRTPSSRQRTPSRNGRGCALQQEIVIRFSTEVTPGADHAARSASSFSAHARTVPFRMTLLPCTSVSNLCDLDRLFAQIKREKGKLDIVFANAGAAKYAALGQITEEHYDSIFNTNVKGLLFTVQKALPLMPDRASIILNASIVASKGLTANSVC